VNHPKDWGSLNPRIQCDVCGKWMRLHARTPDGQPKQNFYGSCWDESEHAKDVCDECCAKTCAGRRSYGL
jgi:hypothetical protein